MYQKILFFRNSHHCKLRRIQNDSSRKESETKAAKMKMNLTSQKDFRRQLERRNWSMIEDLMTYNLGKLWLPFFSVKTV